MNDNERAQWVDNDEGLYHEWRRSGLSQAKFVRKNRAEIDRVIVDVLAVPPRGGNAAASRTRAEEIVYGRVDG